VKGEYVNPDDMISLRSDIDCLEALRAEVCRIPLKPNSNGKIQILSKVDMQKKPYQLPSPNLADSLMMSMVMPTIKRQATKIHFQGWRG
jgi:phage terminase large subunit